MKHGYYENMPSLIVLAKEWAQRGQEVDILTLRRPGQPNVERCGKITIHRLSTINGKSVSRGRYAISSVLFALRCAIFLLACHMRRPFSLIYVQALPDYLVFSTVFPRMFGAAVILDLYDVVPELYLAKFGGASDSLVFRLLILVERFSCRFADHVITPNPFWFGRLVACAADKGHYTWIRYLPDPEEFYPWPSRCDRSGFRIVYAGSLNIHQGLDVAIQAIAEVIVECADAELHIFGEGPTVLNLRLLVSRLGLGVQVHFHPMVPAHELPRLLSSFDLAVVPKRASIDFGNQAESTKILQLMAMGIPVVASRTKIESFYYDESLVKFFESDSPSDLSRCIVELIRNPAERIRLANNGKAYFQRNNWLQIKDGYLGLLDTLIESKQRSKRKERLKRFCAHEK